MVDGDGLEEVGDDCLLKGLTTLFPSSVGKAVGTFGVYDNAAFTTKFERAPG